MELTLKFDGDQALAQKLRQLSGPQIRKAHADALNTVAFHIRKDMQAEIKSVFDRPTPFIVKAPKVFMATPDKPSATIAPTMHTNNEWTRGGKVGVDPQQVLQAQEWGDTRRDKRSEVVLRRSGLLQPGYQTAIPKIPYPGSDDGRGNLRGAFLQRILSYFQAFGEQGFKANMKQKAKDRFEGARKYTNIKTRKEHTVRDQRFFVVHPGREKTSHLAPGIWAARGTHGVDVRPVLMFVSAASYTPRISMDRVSNLRDRRAQFEKQFDYRVSRILNGAGA